MKRLLVKMEDPIFASGEIKKANVTVQVTPAGLALVVDMWLGPDPATRSSGYRATAGQSTGSPQTFGIWLTMPEAGIYHVYFDLYAENILIASYIATEDVIIPGGSVTSITWM